MRTLAIFPLSLLLFTAPALAQNAPLVPLTPPPSPYAAATVNDFLTACKTDQSGCINEVGSTEMQKFEYNGTLCLPSADYANPVPQWLAAHAETHAMPTEDGIYLALKTLYACG